jgi:ABC-type nickel/cobalt efflux system permease component RcnA
MQKPYPFWGPQITHSAKTHTYLQAQQAHDEHEQQHQHQQVNAGADSVAQDPKNYLQASPVASQLRVSRVVGTVFMCKVFNSPACA